MEEILIYVALTSCFFAGLSVLYSKVRPRFPIRVNCWFCQKDLVVTYHERNSWDCPFCEQYNGFSADGGYNKPLQAQWSSLLNPNSNSVAGQFKVPNRLCKSCSINQELKIQQLSTFSPKSEETFDAELSRFKLHLEQVYRLCRQCNRTLEIQLAQEEKLLRPEILAWKLDLSRRHGHGRENMRLYQMDSSVQILWIFMLLGCLNCATRPLLDGKLRHILFRPAFTTFL